MLAGALRTRLRLEALGESATDAGGDPIPAAWEPVEHVYAAVRALSGSEALRGMQLAETITHELTIRYRPGITAAMRAVQERGEGDRIFHFRRVVDPDERRRELRIHAEEVRA